MRPASETAYAGLGSQASFALAAAWVVLMPRTMMASSTIVSTYPLGTALTFVIVFIGVAVIDQRSTNRMRAMMFAGEAILGGCAGVIFVLASDTSVRLACFALAMMATAGLLIHWGRALNERPLDDILSHALAGLGMIALFHFGVLGIGAVLSAVGNAHAFANLELASLSVALLFAGAIGYPSATQPSPTSPGRKGKEAASVGFPTSYLLILCIASLLTSLVSGFIYLPYHYDWNLVACLRSGIVLAAATFAVLHRMRQPEFATTSLNSFFLFSLLLTVSGLALATWATPYSGFIAQGALEAARDCYFVLAFVLFTHATGTRAMPFFPLFAFGMLGSGLYWTYDMGMLFRKLFGYDPSILVPLTSLCTAALAVAFFLLFMRSPSQMRFQAAGSSHPERRHAVGSFAPVDSVTSGDMPPEHEGHRLNEGSEDATASAAFAEKSSMDDALVDKPEIDAASARQIIEKTYEGLLAPYRLSPREMQVSMLVIDGYTAAAASDHLGISIATVKFHLGNCYRKLGIQSKAELIALARDEEAPSAAKESNAQKTGEGMPHGR